MTEETKTETVAADAAEECVCTCKQDKSESIIRKHMLVALGTGVIPPVADIAALTAVQVRMLCLLSETYGFKFKDEINKSLIASIISGYGIPTLFAGALGSLLKLVPFVGTVAGGASMAMVAGASTYALGKVFVHHFESGGTLLDFSPAKMRSYYYEQYKKGENLVKQQKQETATETEAK